MIEFYYTGADNFGDPQIDPNLSLGGFISSSQIPNLFQGALFGEYSDLDIQQNKNEFICIALKNIDANTVDIDSFTLAALTNSLSEYEVGALIVSANACGETSFPKSQNKNSAPVGVVFTPATSFYGESKITFTETFSEGDLIEIKASGTTVIEINYTPAFDNIVIIDDNYFIDKRINGDTFDLYVVQKDLNNFVTAITVERTAISVGTIENAVPVLNTVNLGQIESQGYIGVYIRRKPSLVAKRKASVNENVACEQLFNIFENSLPVSKEEIVNIDLNYEIVP